MNLKIKKVIDEIERTKNKIAELQVLLPELERKRIDMENTEIIKLVRSAEISTAALPAFLESLKNHKNPVPTFATQPVAIQPVISDDSGSLATDIEEYDDEYPNDEDNIDTPSLPED